MSPPTDETRLQRMDATSFAPLLDRAVDIYLTALGRPAEVAPARRLSTRSHLQAPGFRAVAALAGDELVGFAYGYHDKPGQWWHDVVVEALPLALGLRWLSRAFQVTELHVLPAHQGAGLGEQLLRTLLDDVDRDTAVLTAYDEPTAARALYRKVGFTELVTGLHFPGNDEVYVVMAADLPIQVG